MNENERERLIRLVFLIAPIRIILRHFILTPRNLDPIRQYPLVPEQAQHVGITPLRRKWNDAIGDILHLPSALGFISQHHLLQGRLDCIARLGVLHDSLQVQLDAGGPGTGSYRCMVAVWDDHGC